MKNKVVLLWNEYIYSCLKKSLFITKFIIAFLMLIFFSANTLVISGNLKNNVTLKFSAADFLFSNIRDVSINGSEFYFHIGQTSPQQKKNTVTGKVTDQSGAVMVGVVVSIKGTTKAVTTNVNGIYTIELTDKDNVLVFSFVGMKKQEIPTEGKSVINVVLENEASTLSEVVIVGYGSQNKRDVTGSISTVSNEKLMETHTSNVINQLKGNSAGVDIQSSSSTPGGTDQIRIRGNRTMTQPGISSDPLDSPLIVLDGIPFGGSISDISSNDIASLEILKDASSTAIYGSRGSNGVILITTKRGSSGKIVMSYNTYNGVSNVVSELRVLNAKEYAQLKIDATTLNTQNPGTNPYPLTAAEQTGLANGTNTDWQKLIYKQGFTTDQNLSITGGNESTQFGMGAGYYSESGIIPNQRFERYSLRTTLDQKITKHIKVGINSLNSLSFNNTPGGGGVTTGLLKISPLVSPYNTDGSVNLYPMAGSIDAANVSPLTLKTDKSAIYNNTRTLRTFSSLYGEVTFLKYLTYRINVGLDYSQIKTGNYTGPNTFVNSSILTPAQSTASIINAEAYTYTFENILTYDQSFGQNHRIIFTGLFSSQKDHNESSGFNALGIPADNFQNSNFTLANSISPGSAATNFWQERGLLSFMARLNYSYAGKYLLTATIRRDGSSVLAPGNQYFNYPALALGWNVANEGWMKNVNVISRLKVRLSYGKTGNQGSNPYQTLGLLSTTTVNGGSTVPNTYNFGPTSAGQQNGYLVTSLANNQLHWQSTAEFNGGLDFGILKDRITGVVDIYDQRTKDILVNNVLPPSTGASSQLTNLGKTKTQGVEITLSSVNLESANANGFKWTTDLNFSMSRNKIVSLPNGILADINDGWFVGQPTTVIYDVKKIGIWQTGDPDLAKQTSPTEVAGQIRVQDVNNDGKIDAKDKQVIGNYEPKWIGGMTNTLSYKNFDFSFVLYARMGQTIACTYIATDAGSNGYGFFMQSRVNQLKVDYWTPTNPTNAFPRPDASVNGPVFASTLQYTDGSFIKCRSINLGYTIPSKVLTNTGITSFRVYLNVLNPFVLYSPFVRNHFGPDPEGNGTGGPTFPGGPSAAISSSVSGGVTVPGQVITVNANNPATRSFNIGLELKF